MLLAGGAIAMIAETAILTILRTPLFSRAGGSVGNLLNAVFSKPFEVEAAGACRRSIATVDMLSRDDVRRFQREGICVVPGCIGRETIRGAREHALSLVNAGRLSTSGNSTEVRTRLCNRVARFSLSALSLHALSCHSIIFVWERVQGVQGSTRVLYSSF